MMIESNVLVAVALMGALGVLWWSSMVIFRNEMKESRRQSDAKVPQLLNEITDLIPNAAAGIPNFDQLKDDLIEMIEDIMSDAMNNMQMPSAQDHIFGALANIVQHKFTQSSPMASAIVEQFSNIDADDSDVHGPPSQEQ